MVRSSRWRGLVWCAAATCAAGFHTGSPEHTLARWVESKGGFVSPALVSEKRFGRRGLYVSVPVVAGEVLLTVPQQCCISAEFDAQFGLSLHELAVARLLGATSRGEHAEYLEALPTAEPLLASWRAEELRELHSPALVAAARVQRARVSQTIETLRPWVSSELPTSTIEWAERMVRSRALRFEPGWDGLRSSLCMVPLIDLANHATPGAAEEAAGTYVDPVCLVGSVDGAQGLAVLRAARDMSAGDEACFPYRREGNGALLLDYGFAEAPCAGRVREERLWIDLSDSRAAGEGDEGEGGEGGGGGGGSSSRRRSDGVGVREAMCTSVGAEGEAPPIVDTDASSSSVAPSLPMAPLGCSDEMDAHAVASLCALFSSRESPPSEGPDEPPSPPVEVTDGPPSRAAEAALGWARDRILSACERALGGMVTNGTRGMVTNGTPAGLSDAQGRRKEGLSEAQGRRKEGLSDAQGRRKEGLPHDKRPDDERRRPAPGQTAATVSALANAEAADGDSAPPDITRRVRHERLAFAAAFRTAQREALLAAIDELRALPATLTASEELLAALHRARANRGGRGGGVLRR